jgi:hypothetical protein
MESHEAGTVTPGAGAAGHGQGGRGGAGSIFDADGRAGRGGRRRHKMAASFHFLCGGGRDDGRDGRGRAWVRRRQSPRRWVLQF